MRTPTEAEISHTAVQLGLIRPGEPVPPRIRAKVAKTLQVAVQMESAEDAQEATSADFIRTVADTYSGLTGAGLPDEAAARVVAAIAPALWRTDQGAAHAQNP